MRTLTVFFFVVSVAGCQLRADPTRVTRLFGPVVGQDTIVGRAYSGGRVLLLTDRPALVTVDPAHRWSMSRAVTNRNSDVLWGLGVTEDDVLWTLTGQRALGRLEKDGRIAQRIPLSVPHVGLFSRGHELLYQVLDFNPPTDALVAGPPGEQSRHPWSALKTRSYRLARASVAALNLVSCGGTETVELPCWFPDEAVVTLIDSSGGSRRLALPALPVVAPEVLLTSENPARPVRDAFIAAAGDIWVLGSESPRDAPSSRGGRLLARFDRTGALMARSELRQAARLILHASGDGCLLLASDGYVVEVRL